LIDCGVGLAVGESDVHRAQVDARVRGVPGDDCLVGDVFAKSEVRFQQLAMDFGEGAGLGAEHAFYAD